MVDTRTDRLARSVVETGTRLRLRVATAESCTGGLAAAAITAVPGSSMVLECGFVTYSNRAKAQLLGVPPDLIDALGAVSREVAEAMAAGALARSATDAAVSITGVAGPGGGSAAKPVGLVHFACATSAGIRHLERRFGDLGRDEVRAESVVVALELLMDALSARDGRTA